jgi:hypothetical protein
MYTRASRAVSFRRVARHQELQHGGNRSMKARGAKGELEGKLPSLLPPLFFAFFFFFFSFLLGRR